MSFIILTVALALAGVGLRRLKEVVRPGDLGAIHCGG